MLNQKVLKILCAFLFLIASEVSLAQDYSSQKNFSFTLKKDATTSAGVFKSDGTLVRTLWGNKLYTAGTHIEAWDGLTDDGNIAPTDQSYQVKVLSNNVNYEWQGVIGNTSNSLTGATVHHHPEGAMLDMAITGKTAYYTTGYSEGYASQFKFDLTQPQIKQHIIKTSDGYIGQQSFYVATDGIKTYWAGIDAFEKKYRGDYASFVFATNVSDDKEVTFTSGVKYGVTIGRVYNSVISLQKDFEQKINISGLAVQKRGIYLFVARKDLNRIDVLNKNTGTLVTSIKSLTLPRNLKIDGNDDLWMITSSNTVSKYSVNSNGQLSLAGLSITGLVNPLALGISPDNSTLTVVDGGTSQQLKSYSVFTGEAKWTFGQPGGYSNGPEVRDDKFYFASTKVFKKDQDKSLNAQERNYTFITYCPDGTFWVGDLGNLREQHYTANRTFIERIQNLGYLYSVQADPNNPTRVFANYLEFSVDYSKPLDNGKNGSWKLVKNWSFGIDPARYDNQHQRMKDVTTLSNGRTYAIVKDNVRGTGVLVELPPTGNLRFTGIETSAYNVDIRNTLNADGSLGGITSTSLGSVCIWQKKPLMGFTANNNPIWGAAVNLGNSPVITGADPIANGALSIMRNPVTSSGIIVTFDPDNVLNGKRSYGYHLGAVKLGDNKWLWRTSPSTNKNYRGSFPDDGAFDIGNGVNSYAGGFAGVVDKNIFWSYHGEFWKGSQTNKYNHYFDNGLMVGQFGITGPEAKLLESEAFPMFAGNALTGTFIKSGNDLYLYHADEGTHGGIHRWKITGLNTIEEQTVEFSDIAKTPLLGINLMKGLPTYAKLADGTYGWNRKPLVENGNLWTVSTNYLTYQKNSQDIVIKLKTTKGVPTSGIVTRDLGNHSELSQWMITGRIAYLLEAEPDTDYIEVLDKNNKVICRIKRNENFYFNDQAVVSSLSYKSVYKAIKGLNPIKILADEKGITFTYNNSAPITVKPQDPDADWRSPKTLRVYLYDANGRGHEVDLADFRFSVLSTTSTPDEPVIFANDATNILSASHALGVSEIEVSSNNEPYKQYLGEINVGNLQRAKGYWKFRTKATSERKASAIIESPEFTYTNFTASVPSINADDVKNTLTASHPYGISDILVSENGKDFTQYLEPIEVGNVARPEGYWVFKTKAASGRDESSIVKSPAFTFTSTPYTPSAPTIIADDQKNVLSIAHELPNSEIKMSVNNGPFYGYYGQINVGNIARPKGYWKFKIGAKGDRKESVVTESPEFTITYTQPGAPTIAADDQTNTLSASHRLGNSSIKMSINNGPFYGYYGEIKVGNKAYPKGYWKFKIEAKGDRSESPIAESPAFNITYFKTDAPKVTANDGTNTLSASHALGNASIKMSVNNGAFYGYYGEIKVGDKNYPAGYWKFKIEAKGDRSESPIAESPAFTTSATKRNASTSLPLSSLFASNLDNKNGKDVTTDSTKVNKNNNVDTRHVKDSVQELADSKLESLESSLERKPLTKGESFGVSPRMLIYPNPISGNNFTIRLTDFEEGKYQVRLINISGNIILTTTINCTEKNKSINIKPEISFAKGIYFIEVLGQKTVIRSKILKN